jgi:hypothetical protein
MKRYIKSSAQGTNIYPYYRIDHIGAKDKEDHFGTFSLAELKQKLNEFGLPELMAEFGDPNLPEYIVTEVRVPGQFIINSYAGWEVSMRPRAI